jgi:hypothetical protein
MPRILPLPPERTNPDIANAYAHHVKDYAARITNMKRTLGHSHTAFNAYMEWYPLYEEVKKILGERLSPLFAWSISEAANCPLCSTYFRKTIIESGESPETLVLSGPEQEIVDFGAAISKHQGFVADEIYSPIKSRFSDKEIVILSAFAGIMVATNIFNNINQTEIDEYLNPFRKPDQFSR